MESAQIDLDDASEVLVTVFPSLPFMYFSYTDIR